MGDSHEEKKTVIEKPKMQDKLKELG